MSSSDESSGDSAPMKSKNQKKGGAAGKKPAGRGRPARDSKKAEPEKKRKPTDSDDEDNVSDNDDAKDEDFVESDDGNDSDYAPKKGGRGGKTGSGGGGGKGRGKTSSPAKKPTKKRKANSSDEDDDDDADNGDAKKSDDKKFDLGNKRFASISEWKGKTMVDIREFYQNDNGEWKPGKKGISLTEEQFRKLASFIPKIEEKLDADD